MKGFIIGLLLGGVLSFFICAVLTAGSDSDDSWEEDLLL